MYNKRRYQSTHANTSQPGDLVVMLYDGAIRFTRTGQQALVDGDAKVVGESLGRAMDIIAYLQATLRPDAAPELVTHLDRVYTAWTVQMVRASSERDPRALDPVLEQLESLREAWSAARHEASAGGVDAAGVASAA